MRYMTNNDLVPKSMIGPLVWPAATAIGWVVLGTYLLHEHFKAREASKYREKK